MQIIQPIRARAYNVQIIQPIRARAYNVQIIQPIRARAYNVQIIQPIRARAYNVQIIQPIRRGLFRTKKSLFWIQRSLNKIKKCKETAATHFQDLAIHVLLKIVFFA